MNAECFAIYLRVSKIVFGEVPVAGYGPLKPVKDKPVVLFCFDLFC